MIEIKYAAVAARWVHFYMRAHGTLFEGPEYRIYLPLSLATKNNKNKTNNQKEQISLRKNVFFGRAHTKRPRDNYFIFNKQNFSMTQRRREQWHTHSMYCIHVYAIQNPNRTNFG